MIKTIMQIVLVLGILIVVGASTYTLISLSPPNRPDADAFLRGATAAVFAPKCTEWENVTVREFVLFSNMNRTFDMKIAKGHMTTDGIKGVNHCVPNGWIRMGDGNYIFTCSELELRCKPGAEVLSR